jgi:hypothetical protein
MLPLPVCMAILTIGDTTHNTTDMYVYIKNHTTDAPVTRFEVETNGSGLLTVDLTDYPQIEGHDYELWATLTTDNERVEITISAVQYTCFALTFEQIEYETGALITGENVTLEAA